MPTNNSRARLDRALARFGEGVVLRRRIGTTASFTELEIRGTVRGYAPQEISGGVMQGDTRFIISPSEILATPDTWPGAAGGSVWPKIGDQLIAQGRLQTVQAAAVIFEAGDAVRIEAQARG